MTRVRVVDVNWCYRCSLPLVGMHGVGCANCRCPTPLLIDSGRRCYACEGEAAGWRDRRPEGGKIEPACDRHLEPDGARRARPARHARAGEPARCVVTCPWCAAGVQPGESAPRPPGQYCTRHAPHGWLHARLGGEGSRW